MTNYLRKYIFISTDFYKLGIGIDEVPFPQLVTNARGMHLLHDSLFIAVVHLKSFFGDTISGHFRSVTNLMTLAKSFWRA